MKIISRASKEQIITMCGGNQHSHHNSVESESTLVSQNERAMILNQEEVEKEEKAS